MKAKISLAPPWITYWNEIVSTIGKDTSIQILPLISFGENNYFIILVVQDPQKAQALATLLKPTQEFGNITVSISVTTNNGIIEPLPCPLSAFIIADLFNIALNNNPYFEGITVIKNPMTNENNVFPVFKPSVIQFFNDDISNLCQTFTEVAAKVFANVMQKTICNVPILYSTSCNN